MKSSTILTIILALVLIIGGLYVSGIRQTFKKQITTVTTELEIAKKDKEIMAQRLSFETIRNSILLLQKKSSTAIANSDYTLYAETYVDDEFDEKTLKSRPVAIVSVQRITADPNKIESITAAKFTQPISTDKKTIGNIMLVGFYKSLFVYSINYDGFGDSNECSSPWLNNNGNLFSLNLENTTTGLQTPQPFVVSEEVKAWAIEQLPANCAAALQTGI
jgi:hypothetical protein